jgi:hypothetical protein
VTAEVIAIVPRPALWLRVAAWWPSAIGLMVGAALVAGALR